MIIMIIMWPKIVLFSSFKNETRPKRRRKKTHIIFDFVLLRPFVSTPQYTQDTEGRSIKGQLSLIGGLNDKYHIYSNTSTKFWWFSFVGTRKNILSKRHFANTSIESTMLPLALIKL